MHSYEKKSQNGSQGLGLVSKSLEICPGIFQAKVLPLGRRAGVECFELEATTEPTWTIVHVGTGYYKPVFGATMALDAGWCGNTYAQVIAVGAKALLQWFGYKGRTSSFFFINDGVKAPAPTALLLKMGLIKPADLPEGRSHEEVIPPGLSEEQVALLKSLGL